MLHNTVAPHFGQKVLVTWLPSSPMRTNSFACPSTETSRLLNQAPKPNALPVSAYTPGSGRRRCGRVSEQVADSCPHWHSARRVVIGGSYALVAWPEKAFLPYVVFRDGRTARRFVPSKVVFSNRRRGLPAFEQGKWGQGSWRLSIQLR